MSDWGAIQRQSHPEYDNYGVLLIGSGGTGKTTFARRLCLNTFSVEVDPTIEEAYCTIVECDGHTVCLDVCDTYGQAEYAVDMTPFYDRCQGFVIVIDIHWPNPWEFVEQAIEKVRVTKRSVSKILILGNKIDLDTKPKVTTKEAQEFAASHDCTYLEMSAKTGDGVQAAAQHLVSEMRKRILPWKRGTSNPQPDPCCCVIL